MMTTFDLLMIPVWLCLVGCGGLWAWIMADWICFEIRDRRDRRDPEFMPTQILRFPRGLPGLDTQIRNVRGIRHRRDYLCLQDLIVTVTKDYPTKGN